MTMVPHPLVSFVIAVLWLILTGVTPGQMVLAVLVGLVAGGAFGKLTAERVRVRRPGLMLQLAGRVFLDIIRSNCQVAGLILTDARGRRRRSGFVRITLDLTNRNALAMLAIIITSTPGTAWIELDPDDNGLLLHVFDLKHDQDWSRVIKTRYEPLLMEIFR